MNMRATLTKKDVAERHGFPIGTQSWWRHQRTGPPSFVCGKRVLYFEDEFYAWLESQAAADEAHETAEVCA